MLGSVCFFIFIYSPGAPFGLFVLLMFSGICESKFSESSENRKISRGGALSDRQQYACQGLPPIGGKHLFFGQVNPLLTYKGFGAAGVDLSLTSRPRLRGIHHSDLHSICV